MHPRFKQWVTDPEPTGILLTASKSAADTRSSSSTNGYN